MDIAVRACRIWLRHRTRCLVGIPLGLEIGWRELQYTSSEDLIRFKDVLSMSDAACYKATVRIAEGSEEAE